MITAEQLGARFNKMRKALKHSQERVSKQTQLTQTQISNFENARFSSIEVFIALTNYYLQYFYLDNLYYEYFEPQPKDEAPAEREVLKEIVHKKIELMIGNINKQGESILKILK